MPLNYPQQGAGDVASYQLSAVPFVTSSAASEVSTDAISVKFPNVTRFFVVHNTSGNDMRIGFTAAGVAAEGGVSGSVPSNPAGGESSADRKNYFVLAGNGTTGRLEIRCKELYFRRDGGSNCSFSIMAGITPISDKQFPILTGSSGYDGVG